MDTLIIYSTTITSRLKYVLKIVFHEIYQIDYQLTDQRENYLSSEATKINYSANQIINDEIHILPSKLLFQIGIREVELGFFKFNDVEYLFKSNNDKAYIHDIFASIFYLISRYEEYLPHLKDKYGRYLHTESIAYKNGFLHKPIVNIWINNFIRHLELKNSSLKIKKPKFKFISTIDIDNAFLINGKGFVRSLAFVVKSIFNINVENLQLFIDVLLNKRKDPFDTYTLQFNLNHKYNLNTKYFILLGDYADYDKNLSHTNSNVATLIKRIADFSSVGIHPSFASNLKVDILKEEVSRLENIQKREVLFSRQHFLKLSLPTTYNRLLSLGIYEDYTMGYGSALGFRAGIASPYSFYDLDIEQTLPIKVFPFAITDDILRFNLNLDPKKAIEEINDIVKLVKKENGTLITIWHNDTFSNFGAWKGWKGVYEDMIKLIKS